MNAKVYIRTFSGFHNKRCSRDNGAALVMTLGLVTILTLILLAYFNLVKMDWLATRNYSQSLKAEQVGRGAMDYVIGQLRSEMANGTTPLRVGNYSIYTNIVSSNVQPEVIGTNTGISSLIKLSTAGKGVFGGAASGEVAVDALSSTSSANGRRISTGRWARSGFGTPDKAPSWFLVGPRGVTNVLSSDIKGRFAFAIYDLGSMIDINVAGHPSTLTAAQKKALKGSLAGLDLSTLPGLDSSSVDSIIQGFRNRTSAAAPSNYTNYVLNIAATNGFMRVVPGDDTFLSRQDLLEYAKARGVTSAATNLTVFTRTINTPAWSPTTNAGSFSIQTITRSNVVGWNPQGGAITSTVTLNCDYRANATTTTSVNRNFLSQTVSSPFSRVDGSMAVAGEPLVLKRFPLSWLSWLSKDGPSSEAKSRFGDESAASAKIKEAFGLVWDSTNKIWVYTSPTSANGGGNYNGSGNSDGAASTSKAARTVKTLAVVASENREPDFFELLQAGILRGSLGQRSSLATPVCTQLPGEITSEGHILQIGANIIDQYDADDFPTLIRAYMPVVMPYDAGISHGAWAYVIGSGTGALTPFDFAGVENIPYLMGFRIRPYRPLVNPPPSAYWNQPNEEGRPNAEGMLLPQFWNPHRNASNTSAERPATFRLIQTFGSIRMWYANQNFPEINGYGRYTSPASEWPSTVGNSQPIIAFNGALTFAVPELLKPEDVVSTSTPRNIHAGLPAVAGQNIADLELSGFAGFWLGDANDMNAPYDKMVWAVCGGTGLCPVNFDIAWVCINSDRGAALPSSDPFWKGDSTTASSYNSRFAVFELQYLDSGVWKTYQRFDDCFRGAGDDQTYDTLAWNPPYRPLWSFTSEFHSRFYARIDPRGSRFGLVDTSNPNYLNNGEWNGDPRAYYNTPLANATGSRGRPNGEASVRGIPGNQSGAMFFTPFDPETYPGQWKQRPFWEYVYNLVGGERYTDNDLVQRRADPTKDPTVASPLDSSGTVARPIMLNRPFTSVGDLGYVYRDLPFKTLDLFSTESADSGLLDLFCVDESPVITAGRLNVNIRNSAVLTQVFNGAIKSETSGTTVTSTEAADIADALTQMTQVAPLTGIWDLPKFLASSTYSSAVSGDLRNIKTQKESVTRSLAGIADARCWNLLIDVVAQAGLYPAGVTSPDQFIVQGERRYWLQVSIDRITGKIVDQQLETVFE